MDKIKHLKNPIYLGLIEAFLLNAESKEVVEIYIRTELDLSGGSCFCGGSHGKADETYLFGIQRVRFTVLVKNARRVIHPARRRRGGTQACASSSSPPGTPGCKSTPLGTRYTF